MSVKIADDGSALLKFTHASDYVISITDRAAIDNKKQLQRVAMTMKQLHMYAYSDLQWLQSQQLHIARRELANKTAFKLNIL